MVEKKRNIKFTPKPGSLNVFKVKNGKWVDSRKLKDQKEFIKKEINIEAEKIRKKYISAYPGQIEIYIDKYLDAKSYIDAGYPAIEGSEYPFVQAEAEAINGTNKKAADLIIDARKKWLAIASEIEKVRRRGKININKAKSSNEINEILTNTIAELEKI